MQEMI